MHDIYDDQPDHDYGHWVILASAAAFTTGLLVFAGVTIAGAIFGGVGISGAATAGAIWAVLIFAAIMLAGAFR